MVLYRLKILHLSHSKKKQKGGVKISKYLFFIIYYFSKFILIFIFTYITNIS